MFKRKSLKCSFCGKTEGEVAKLVAGPKVYICDECVTLADQIMQGHPSAGTKVHRTRATLFQRLWRRIYRKIVRGPAERRGGMRSMISRRTSRLSVNNALQPTT